MAKLQYLEAKAAGYIHANLNTNSSVVL